MEIISRKEAKEKGLKKYFTGKPCKNGHICERYVTGKCVRCNYEFQQKYNKKHAEKYQEIKRNESKKWKARNPKRNAIESRMRASISGLIKWGRTEKGIYSSKKIGCSSDEFVKHIESQFTYNMDWECRYLWDIDHFRPTSSFDLFDEKQMEVCFNWRNLQPLWKVVNSDKRDKYNIHLEKLWIKRMRDYGYEGELFLKFKHKD